ncbi:MAG: hypothetical protein O3B13_02320 [Planctomycetota bacterium]|nr:hypothetical protein [Planctomycetota bacterium]MDA1161915.1 hypothetical protein [Planctomycetota bacterium]
MFRRGSVSYSAAYGLLILIAVSGCGTFTVAKLPDLSAFFDSNSGVRDEETHRLEYQESRHPDELKWLLANRLHSGMTVSEVSRTIGERGQRLYDDSWVKKGGGYYQSGDEAWKWAQDRNGQSLILVFRDGHLVNFDPVTYRSEQSDGNSLVN